MAERVYCLYRVSTNKQVDHDENNQADIPMQRKACHDFAAKMGWVIVGEEQETGVSGYKAVSYTHLAPDWKKHHAPSGHWQNDKGGLEPYRIHQGPQD